MTEDVNQPLETAGIKDPSDQLTSTTSSDQQKQPVDAPPAGVNPGQPPQGTMAPTKITPTPTATTTMTRTTTKTSKVTFMSLPREIRDMIWNEVLTPEDEIFATNISCKCRCKDIRDIQAHVLKRDNWIPALSGPPDSSVGLVYAPLLLTCQTPPLAHVCYESREYALRRYESAYRKVHAGIKLLTPYPEEDDFFEKMGGRLRWLSRKAVRYLCLDPNDNDDEEEEEGEEEEGGEEEDEEEEEEEEDDDRTGIYEDNRLVATLRRKLYILEQTSLGEDDVLLLRCRRQAMSTSKNIRLAILHLLTKAKDYQIKVVCDLPDYHVIPMAMWFSKSWGVFDNRAPGCDFDKPQFYYTKHFVEIRDLLDVFGFVVSVKESLPDYQVNEVEEGLGEFIRNVEGHKRLMAEFLEPFETLWAEGVKDIKSSRYGRMPKLGAVVESRLARLRLAHYG